jgi:hypothetical protein
MQIVFIVIAIVVLLFLIFILPGILVIGANEVGILTKKMTGNKLPQGTVVARKGENGLQAGVLMPGIYWKFWVFWKWEKAKITVIPPGKIGIVESIDGQPLPAHRILGDAVECSSFQDAQKFLENGGYRGGQVDTIRPGSYRINTRVFKINVADATMIDKNQVGLVVAEDGKVLPNGYVIAPEPEDENNKYNHQHYQNGQEFINAGGYRGPQLETLQPGQYYINIALFRVTLAPIAEVAPGYVAVIRSNVGAELEKSTVKPSLAEEQASLKGPVHEEVEKLLITNKYTRGIWREPVAPGKYNLNTIAYTPYMVPTSAVTIDWAGEGKIGTDVKGVPSEGVLYKFNPLRVTSMDGFQLDVNVRMVIRVKPENAAFIIARFGSVDNLIDQIVHPLIDSSFRNKAGEKKAIDFFQSRTILQLEALAHARSVFEEYNVEAQNLLVAYINIPESLLETQTQKEIALQQQTQFAEQARAQEKNIDVQEKAARAAKQKDVINAKLEIDIKTDLATARMREAEGEATYLQKTNAATGIGLAEGYERQRQALGAEGTTLVNVIKALAEKNIPIVPTTLVSGSGDGGGFGNLIGALTAKYARELAEDKPATPEKK